MKFVKMHGLGNDFVFLEDKTEQIKIFRTCQKDVCSSYGHWRRWHHRNRP